MDMAATDAGDGLSRPEWRWDVALSFAGAQRDYVGQVAEALKARGLRCFYDADEKVELWGKHLAEALPATYSEDAAVVVVFISADYVAGDWTRTESQAMFARAVRERREYVLPGRFDDTPLPGLLPDVATVDLRTVTPQQFADIIVDKLARLGIARAGGPTGAARPAGAVRVGEADPRRLGVHASISVPEIADEVLPEYVPRDADAGTSGVRARVAAAADRGGFLLLVGGSSVGKTRCAVEAVKTLLPDWWLVHPDGPAEISALARAPLSRTVVWLDELQRYLDGEHGLTAGVIRSLLNGPHPPLIIGTLWPDYLTAYTALPSVAGSDPYVRERQVLELATIVRIGPEFSSAERGRARAAAARDRRLAIALDSAGDQLTQILAAAPQLVARWEDARTASPYAWAVLTAALDAARLGARAPLSADFLREAVPDYCSSRQRAEAPSDWFEQAMAYATGTLYGAAAALTPAGAGMGLVAGYTAADYLIQQASGERRAARAPASAWDAILAHVRDPDDIARLARSASDRLLYRYAIPLYQRIAQTSDEYAVASARLMMDRGDLDEARRILEARADTADERTVADEFGYDEELPSLLAYLRDLESLRALADAGDEAAARELAEALADSGPDESSALADAGDIVGLRDRAGADESAAIELAKLLASRGDLDQLRDRADTSDWYAASELADVLAHRGDLAELRARADTGDENAAMKLSDVLADRGDLAELRARADTGDENAAIKLSDVLADRGDLDQLRDRADAGDENAAERLADVLAHRGDLAELRARADTGDENAAIKLSDVLAAPGDLDQPRDRADAGDELTAIELTDVLAASGDLDQLRDRADAGDWYAAAALARVLADRGDLDQLRDRANSGDENAAIRLADVLAARRDLDQLRDRANSGDENAAIRLADVLAALRDLDQLRDRANADDWYAGSALARVLAACRDLDQLRDRVTAGDGTASPALAGILAARGGSGDIAELGDLADAGDLFAAMRLADVLAAHGDVAGLRARVDVGDWFAARLLPGTMIAQGQPDEGERLQRFGLNLDGSIAEA